jgi:hypothetical protein
MRRGQFFSLTSGLLIVLLLIIFFARSSALEEQMNFRATRAQVGLMAGFAQNFGTLDVPRMLQTGSRLALTSRSAASPSAVTYAEFVDIMRDGEAAGTTYFSPLYGTDSQFASTKATLPFSASEPMYFNYTLLDVEQVSPDTLLLHFSVNYYLSANGVAWRAQNKLYDVNISVYSVTSPTYSMVIDKTWSPSSSGCLAQELFSSAGSCSYNLIPPTATAP